MLPVLLRFGWHGASFRIGSYTVLVFCGILAALLIVLRRARVVRLSPRELLPVFIAREKRVPHPMMPLHLFKNKIFSGTNLYTFFLYAGLSAGMFFLSLNLIQIQGYRQFEAGLAFLPFTLLLTLLSAVAGKLSDRYGPKFFLVAGATITGAALLFLAFIPKTSGPTQYWSTFFPGILIFGAGMTFVVAPLTATVMGCVSDQYSGVASGVNNAVTRTSGVFANAIFGALAVLLFSSALQKDLAKTSFEAESKKEIAAQVVNLGNAKAPSHLPDADRRKIQPPERRASRAHDLLPLPASTPSPACGRGLG